VGAFDGSTDAHHVEEASAMHEPDIATLPPIGPLAEGVSTHISAIAEPAHVLAYRSWYPDVEAPMTVCPKSYIFDVPAILWQRRGAR
jgi:hypothetical protein